MIFLFDIYIEYNILLFVIFNCLIKKEMADTENEILRKNSICSSEPGNLQIYVIYEYMKWTPNSINVLSTRNCTF